MSFCTKCGEQSKDSDRFCGSCGQPLKKSDQKKSPQTVTSADQGTTEPGRDSAESKYQGVGIRLLAQVFDAVPIVIFFFVVGNMVASGSAEQTTDGFELQGAKAIALILLTTIFPYSILPCWKHGGMANL